MQKIDTIYICSPRAYIHSQCFFEAALGMREALSAFQVPPTVTTDSRRVSGKTLVFGAHLFPANNGTIEGGDYIIFNSEQVRPDSSWFSPGYLDNLRRYPVWDYAYENIERLLALSITAHYCPIGYSPCMSNIQRQESATIVGGGTKHSYVDFAPWGATASTTPAGEQDIDVLFVGSLNERRLKIIESIRAGGIPVVHIVGYGAYRDRLIARAKVALNLHYYDDSPTEHFRLSHLYANRKCVVQEGRGDIAGVCAELLKDDSARSVYETASFDEFSKLSFKDTLRSLLKG